MSVQRCLTSHSKDSKTAMMAEIDNGLHKSAVGMVAEIGIFGGSESANGLGIQPIVLPALSRMALEHWKQLQSNVSRKALLYRSRAVVHPPDSVRRR